MGGKRQSIPWTGSLLLGVCLGCLEWPKTVLGNPFPSVEDSYREERLIEGMDRGIKRDYRGAIAIFTKLLQRYPGDGEIYFNRGIARSKLRDYGGAIRDYTSALEHNPQLAEAYQARAELYWQLGQRRLAMQDLKMAIAHFQQQQNPIAHQHAEALLAHWQTLNP